MRIHRHRQKKPKFVIPTFKVNDRIKAPEVRVIHDGQAEVLPIAKAIAMARELDMDLIEVSPKADPPVCKIMEYGAFKYQKEKEVKKQRATSKDVEVKGIRLSFKIGINDLNIRLGQAKKFLDQGHKIKVEMQLRGREREHKDRARELFNNFVELLRQDYDVKIESPIQFQSGRMNMIVARNK